MIGGPRRRDDGGRRGWSAGRAARVRRRHDDPDGEADVAGDQPVVVRLGARDGSPRRTAVPRALPLIGVRHRRRAEPIAGRGDQRLSLGSNAGDHGRLLVRRREREHRGGRRGRRRRGAAQARRRHDDLDREADVVVPERVVRVDGEADDGAAGLVAALPLVRVVERIAQPLSRRGEQRRALDGVAAHVRRDAVHRPRPWRHGLDRGACGRARRAGAVRVRRGHRDAEPQPDVGACRRVVGADGAGDVGPRRSVVRRPPPPVGVGVGRAGPDARRRAQRRSFLRRPEDRRQDEVARRERPLDRGGRRRGRARRPRHVRRGYDDADGGADVGGDERVGRGAGSCDLDPRLAAVGRALPPVRERRRRARPRPGGCRHRRSLARVAREGRRVDRGRRRRLHRTRRGGGRGARATRVRRRDHHPQHRAHLGGGQHIGSRDCAGDRSPGPATVVGALPPVGVGGRGSRPRARVGREGLVHAREAGDRRRRDVGRRPRQDDGRRRRGGCSGATVVRRSHDDAEREAGVRGGGGVAGRGRAGDVVPRASGARPLPLEPERGRRVRPRSRRRAQDAPVLGDAGDDRRPDARRWIGPGPEGDEVGDAADVLLRHVGPAIARGAGCGPQLVGHEHRRARRRRAGGGPAAGGHSGRHRDGGAAAVREDADDERAWNRGRDRGTQDQGRVPADLPGARVDGLGRVHAGIGRDRAHGAGRRPGRERVGARLSRGKPPGRRSPAVRSTSEPEHVVRTTSVQPLGAESDGLVADRDRRDEEVPRSGAGRPGDRAASAQERTSPCSRRTRTAVRRPSSCRRQSPPRLPRARPARCAHRAACAATKRLPPWKNPRTILPQHIAK